MGDEEAIKSRLQDGSAATARDDNGCNLLYYVQDNETLAHKLIAAGCNVNLRDFRGESPLLIAVEKGHSKLVKILLDAGANHAAKYRHKDYRPIHMAAFYGFADIAELLIRAGADVNVLDRYHCSPLHTTAMTYIIDSGEWELAQPTTHTS